MANLIMPPEDILFLSMTTIWHEEDQCEWPTGSFLTDHSHVHQAVHDFILSSRYGSCHPLPHIEVCLNQGYSQEYGEYQSQHIVLRANSREAENITSTEFQGTVTGLVRSATLAVIKKKQSGMLWLWCGTLPILVLWRLPHTGLELISCGSSSSVYTSKFLFI